MRVPELLSTFSSATTNTGCPSSERKTKESKSTVITGQRPTMHGRKLKTLRKGDKYLKQTINFCNL
jgi:hypothetical protein